MRRLERKKMHWNDRIKSGSLNRKFTRQEYLRTPTSPSPFSISISIFLNISMRTIYGCSPSTLAGTQITSSSPWLKFFGSLTKLPIAGVV